VKVRIPLVVEVDPREWRHGAGSQDDTLQDVREAVRSEVQAILDRAFQDDPYLLLRRLK
jgi:hypothetical protein